MFTTNRGYRFICSVIIFVLLLCTIGANAEISSCLEPTISFDTDEINKALIVSDDEIYLSGFTSNGSWLRKTNIHNDVVSEWNFSDVVGLQPVIQCVAVADGSILVGLVDSYTQKVAVAIIKEDETKYIQLPDTMKVLLSSIRADESGLSIISFIDNKSDRTIYHTHVSPDGLTDSIQVGYSTVDDIAIGDSFSYTLQDRIYLLRMTKVPGNNYLFNRELVVLDQNGQQQWCVLLPEDLIVSGMEFDDENLYMHGFQRLENSNCACVMCYDHMGEHRWTKIFSDIRTINHMAVKDKSICFIGEAQDTFGQWIAYCCDIDGKPLLAHSITLPEAYNTFCSFQDSHINMVQNAEHAASLWKVDW